MSRLANYRYCMKSKLGTNGRAFTGDQSQAPVIVTCHKGRRWTSELYDVELILSFVHLVDILECLKEPAKDMFDGRQRRG